MKYYLDKENFPKFMDSLIKDYNTYSPIWEKGSTLFAKVYRVDEIDMDILNTDKTPKPMFLPQREVMFRFEKIDNKPVIVDEERIESKRILFGVRPCDAKSIALLDVVFSGYNFKDDLYHDKRENTVIIGMGCNEPKDTCFCTSFNIGPFSPTGSDIFFSDIEEGYVVVVETEPGQELVNRYISYFTDAREDQILKEQKTKDEVNENFPGKINLEGLKEKLDKSFEKNELWKQLQQKCISCSACSYTCPTCHCFDILDETKDNKGERVRFWDSCMFSLFTLHASGHNPREEKFQRMRQRLLHKFNYFVHNNGDFGCVGCGRCIDACPVNMDIRSMIEQLNEQL